MTTPAPLPTPSPNASRRAQLGWCLYDFGNSGFAVVFPVAFAVFFSKTIVGGEDGRGDALWGVLQSTSMALVALAAPFLGGVADHAGARGRLLFWGTVLGVGVVLSFHALGPGMVLPAFLLGALANVAFEGSNVFYNAYLPDLAPTSHQGRLSARAFGLGYFGSLIALGGVAALSAAGLGAHVWTWVAVQWAIGGTFALRWLPEDVPTGVSLWRAGADGFRRTGTTIREVWATVRLRRFLIAYFIYMDGVHTVIVFAALYAEGTLGYTTKELLGLIALVQLTALAGALVLAGPTDRVGPRRIVLGLLVWWLLVVVGAFFAPSKVAFAVVGGLAGLGLGSIQAASRTFMARLIPRGKEAEYFGFYALCGKTGAILGPLVFAGVTWALAGDRRPAVLSVGAFFLLGGWLLRKVSTPPWKARPPDPGPSGSGAGMLCPSRSLRRSPLPMTTLLASAGVLAVQPWIWGVLGGVALLVVYFINVYNGLVRARNEKDNAWSQIDVQLKRRHDLIPNLVETAKGYMKHESETLEKVIAARNQAVGAKGPAAQGAAEGALTGALTGFFGLVESYPDLKANANFLNIQEELTGTENRIGFARQAYNDAATTYNNKREVFPANLISGGFAKAELFEIEVPAEREVPKVEF